MRTHPILLAALIAVGIPLIGMSLATPQTNPSSSTQLEIPDGPLLRPAPKFSKWKISFRYPETQKLTGDEVHQVVTTRTGDIASEEMVDGRNCRGERWFVGDVQYRKPFGKSEWYESSPGRQDAPNRDSDYDPLPESGFRDWDWVNDKAYVGKLEFSGRECFVFLPQGPNGQDAADPGKLAALIADQPSVAFVDASTRMPVSMRTAGVTRTYEFQPAPTTVLSLPGDLSELVKKGEEARNRLHQRPPRPY